MKWNGEELVQKVVAAAIDYAGAEKLSKATEEATKAAKDKFEKDTEHLRREIERLENEVARQREAVQNAESRERKADSVMYSAQRKQRKAEIMAALFAGDKAGTMEERLTQIQGNMHLGWGRDEKGFRAVKHNRVAAVQVFGASNDDCAAYLAFKDGVLVSCLYVNKAQHVGGATYSYEYGCKVDREAVGAYQEMKNGHKVYSREGLSMKEWLDPKLVEFVGISERELKTYAGVYHGYKTNGIMGRFFKIED